MRVSPFLRIRNGLPAGRGTERPAPPHRIRKSTLPPVPGTRPHVISSAPNMALQHTVSISDFDYPLPDERIARFPADERDASRLLVYRAGTLTETRFRDIGGELPADTTLVFNNTRVIRARIVMHKPSGARIEVFCLEPHEPADYERAFATRHTCRWQCIVG